MATRRNNERLRFRYGICLNDNCEKGRSKEVQEISARKELICPECGKALHECPPPRQKNNKTIYSIISVLVLVALGFGFWMLFSEDKNSNIPEPIIVNKDSIHKDSTNVKVTSTADSLQTNEEKTKRERDSLQTLADSLAKLANQQPNATAHAPKQVQTTAPVPAPAPLPKTESSSSTHTSGSKNLGYATYKGTLRNGLPDDVNGRLIFNSNHVIDNRDPKRRIAEPGDYVIGEFSDGHLVQGIWYGSDNQVKGSIIIGK